MEDLVKQNEKLRVQLSDKDGTIENLTQTLSTKTSVVSSEKFDPFIISHQTDRQTSRCIWFFLLLRNKKKPSKKNSISFRFLLFNLKHISFSISTCNSFFDLVRIENNIDFLESTINFSLQSYVYWHNAILIKFKRVDVGKKNWREEKLNDWETESEEEEKNVFW